MPTNKVTINYYVDISDTNKGQKKAATNVAASRGNKQPETVKAIDSLKVKIECQTK